MCSDYSQRVEEGKVQVREQVMIVYRDGSGLKNGRIRNNVVE